MRVKTINAIVEEVRLIDGSTAVNQSMIRVLAENKKLDFLYRGNRLVCDADKLPEQLNQLFRLIDNTEMPRIRSIHNAFLELRELNPELGISEEMIRRLVGMGKLPHIRVGNRAYVALESFDPPYNECLLCDDYRDSEKAMIDEIVKKQFAQSMERRHKRKNQKVGA